MLFEKEIEKYLRGTEFSSTVNVAIARKEKKILYRTEYLEELVQKKNIIHFGCVDHLPLISEKIKNNTWLHKRISEKASNCMGIDINKEGIDYLIKLGYSNSLCFDILNDNIPEEIKNNKWDYLLMGEILEHVDNPVLFLSTLRNKCQNYINEIIITVPSAFRLRNIKNTFRGHEYINSDHRYWFTPYTLAKVLTIAGYNSCNFQFCNNYYLSKHSVVNRFLLKKIPALRETVVMVAKFR